MKPSAVEKTPMDHARFFAEDSLRNMPSLIDKIRYRRKPIDLRACYGSLSGYHLKLGIFNYFVEGNLQGFKQHLYVACKLELAAIALDSYQRFSVTNMAHYAACQYQPQRHRRDRSKNPLRSRA
jgi:hypothetical protein